MEDNFHYKKMEDDLKNFESERQLQYYFETRSSLGVNILKSKFFYNKNSFHTQYQTWNKWRHLGVSCPEGFEAAEGLYQFQLNSSGSSLKTTVTEGFQLLVEEPSSV